MIKFFRKIRQKTLTENKFGKYMTYAIGEIVLVVIGILIALAINNWKELNNEKKNATILAESLLADLVKDTSALNNAIKFNTKKEEAIINFISLIHLPKESWNTTEFYKGMSTTFTTFPFEPTDGTYSQLKSTGSLKLFNQDLVNKLNEYDNQVKKTIFRDELIEKSEWELVPFASTIVNFEVTGDLRFNKPITHNPYIKLDDQATKDIFINKILTVKIMMGRSLEEYNSQLKKAENLIKEIKNNFELNNRN